MMALPFEGLDPDEARSFFLELGAVLGWEYSQSSSGQKTMVVMSPLDADFLGKGFMSNATGIANQLILWCHTSQLLNGDTVSSIVHRYNSDQAQPEKVVVLASLGLNTAELRTMILQAADEGLSISDVEIVCPYMSERVWERLACDFGSDLAERKHATLSLLPDEIVRAASLEKLLNLPGDKLAYLPACVFHNFEPSGTLT